MRTKLNQRRPRAIPCRIPRPPTPSQSVQVQTLKKMLQTNRETSSSLSMTSSSRSAMTECTSRTRNMSSPTSSPTSQTVINSLPHHLQQRNHHLPQPHLHSLQNSNHRLPPHLHPKLQVRETSHPSSPFMKESSSSSDSSNSDTASSSSQEVTNEPGDAIEPNEEFPAPPEDFLEDIKAFRKQEEIEGPSNISGQSQEDVRNFVLSSSLNRFDSIPNHISRSFNGNGSLNSSITETTESSWSNSPVSSPLPSPCPSINSISSFNLPEDSQKFVFPQSGHPLTSSPTRNSLRLPNSHGVSSYPRLPPYPSLLLDPSLRSRMTARGVSLAPLHSSSLERESIYHRLPPNGHAYDLLPRLPSSPLSPSTTSSISTSTSALRPPDYMTAMQRLSLSKVSTSKMPSGVVTQSTSSLPVTSSVQSIPQSNQNRTVSQPLKSITSLSSSLPEKQSLASISECGDKSGDSIPVRLRRSSISSSCSEDRSGQPSSRPASQVSLKVKKRVSFSDQVELVSHSEDMKEEEHLPNPLLERVLGKAFLTANNIRNG